MENGEMTWNCTDLCCVFPGYAICFVSFGSRLFAMSLNLCLNGSKLYAAIFTWLIGSGYTDFLICGYHKLVRCVMH